MLEIDALTVTYGGSRALSEVSLSVREGQFVAIVGPNGAGKTTLFKAISGTVTPLSGRIRYDGQDLLEVPPAERARLGIAHVPEGRQVFKSLSVLENLETGGFLRAAQQKWQRNLERVYAMFPVLAERRKQLAGTLSGGEQQMLAIGRCLVMAPRLILLDEPSLGLAPATADLIFEHIEEIHRIERVTTLLVEQRVAEALQSCDAGYVLETGRVVLQGPRDALLANDRVRQAYLGM